MEWGKFRLGDLFDIQSTLSFNKESLVAGNKYDYITRTSQNQGILQETGFVNEENINSAGNWSLGLLQMDFFYRHKPWYAGQFVRKITPKIQISEKAKLFFTVLLNQQKTILLSVLVRDVDKTFKNLEISLPTKNGKIDFEFMESFIQDLENERIKELNNYLEATGLNDYILTDEEEKVLRDFESGKFEWGEFRIGKIFDISHYGKQRSQQDLQRNGELKYNFVMQNENNNGIIEKVPEQVGNDFNLIPGNSISAFTHLSKVYYQEEPFYSKQGSNVYTLKNNDLNKQRAKFIISAINVIIGEIEYGKNTASRLENYQISLPTINNKPNYELMETLISAVQKLVIKDVVMYVDEKISFQ